ncbi:MAG TPA: element excision factor XisI family protein [Blastocatellia bacterium]|nr:element excision factor XisI family protein [Blastocatellia bacterium]
MDQTVSYADILTRVLREEGREQPRLQPIRIDSVCDHETGQYLLIATGWENKQRVDSILFHARLVDDKVVIETDNIEEGLKPALVREGIAEEDIVTSLSPDKQDSEPVAA